MSRSSHPMPPARDTFEIKITQNHLTFGMPGYNFNWIDAAIPGGLNWNQGVFQFAQHSYNPTKDDGCGVGVLPCTANTWHWDNISISPAIPFNIIKADRRYIDSASQTLNFNAPAPAGSNLRFSGIGQIQVAFNGGAFQPATKAQSSFLGGNYHADHMSSYWMPVPTGTKSIQLKFAKDDWYQGPFIAKDFALWSANGQSAPTRTATTTSTATASATSTAVAARRPRFQGTVDLEGRSDDSGTIVSATPAT